MNRRRWILVGLLVAVVLVTIDVLVEGPLTHLDRDVMLRVDMHQQHSVRRVADDVSAVGRPVVAMTAAGLALLVMVVRRRWLRAIEYAAISAVVVAVTVALRAAVGRSSPTFGPHVHVGGSSFPSGHVLLAGLAAGAVALAVGRVSALWVAAVVTVIVAAARVYDFSHFPTDVVAAVLLAAVPVTATWKKRPQRSPA